MRRQSSLATTGVIALTVGLLVLNLHSPAAAATIDPSAAVRGSLGVSLEDLAVHTTVGDITLYINGGLALLFAAIAGLAARNRTGERNGAQRTVSGGPVRAVSGETWSRLSRPMRG